MPENSQTWVAPLRLRLLPQNILDQLLSELTCNGFGQFVEWLRKHGLQRTPPERYLFIHDVFVAEHSSGHLVGLAAIVPGIEDSYPFLDPALVESDCLGCIAGLSVFPFPQHQVDGLIPLMLKWLVGYVQQYVEHYYRKTANIYAVLAASDELMAAFAAAGFAETRRIIIQEREWVLLRREFIYRS